MTKLKHVMIDLETRGTRAGCAILSLGAVVFDFHSHTMGKEFYSVISAASCEECFLSEEPATMKWWDAQPPEARAVIEASESPEAPPLQKVLAQFNNFLSFVGAKRDIRIYGNGADFDNPILRVAYAAAELEPFYEPYAGRCYRTLKNLNEIFEGGFYAPPEPRQGTHHNALDDAKFQARHLMKIVSVIKGEL